MPARRLAPLPSSLAAPVRVPAGRLGPTPTDLPPRWRRAPIFAGLWCWLFVTGCDALVTNNPGNCIHNPAICDSSSVCNPRLAICQPRVLGVLGGAASVNDNLRYGLSGPLGVSFYEAGGSTKLLVADTGNHRVLIWNSVPTENQPPDVVLGQPAFDTNVADYNGSSALSMTLPQSVVVIGGKLIVADSGNNRLLIWNSIPTSSYRPADVVWGQLNSTTATPNQGRGATNPLARGVNTPMVAAAGSRLVVTDSVNNRVLVFNAVPTSRDDYPNYLIGQSLFTDNAVLPLGADSMSRPTGGCGYASSGGQEYLLVPDINRERVLGWNLTGLTPTTDPKAPPPAPLAALVLGQPSYTSSKANAFTGANFVAGLNGPAAALGFGNRMWIADASNDRVVGYGTSQLFPPPASPPAISPLPQVVLGQPANATSYSGSLDIAPPLQTSLDNPRSIAATRSYLAVADTNNNRILLWKGDPDALTSSSLPSLALGQPLVAGTNPSFTSRLLNSRRVIDQTTLSSPRSISGQGTRLYIADRENHRVLGWDIAAGAPTQITGAWVLGQVDTQSARPGKGATGTNHPTGVAVSPDGGMLAVADTDNHRVLIWDGLPSQTGAAATRVIGQVSLDPANVLKNQGHLANALQGNELSFPSSVGFVAGKLVVSDSDNDRLLLFPTTAQSGETATWVLGQPDMKGSVPLLGPQGLFSPTGISSDDRYLYVADTGNFRVLGYPLPLTGSSASASLLLGEYDYFEGSRERASLTSVNGPRGVLALPGLLVVADTQYHRALGFRPPFLDGQAASSVFGQPNSDSGLNTPNNGGMSINTLNQPSSLYATEEAIYIADTGNNRILVLSPWL